MKKTILFIFVLSFFASCSKPAKKVDIASLRSPEKLQKYLSDPDPKNRYLAIDTLEKLEDVSLYKKAEIVTPSLEDEAPSVKRKAVDIVSDAEYIPATNNLIEVHKKGDAKIKDRAAQGLAKMGPTAKQYLFDQAIREIEEEKKSPEEAFGKTYLNAGDIRTLLWQTSIDEVEKYKILFAINSEYAGYSIKEDLDRETDAEQFFLKLIALKDYVVLYSIDYLYLNLSRPGYYQRNLAVIRYFQIQKDHRFLPLLEKLAGSSENEIRQNALSALRSIRGY